MALSEGKLGQAAQHTKDTLATNYQRGLAGVTAVALAMIGAGVYKAPSAESASLKGTQSAVSLLSSRYMKKHCKIVASVNVGADHLTGHNSGLAVEGKNIETTVDGKSDQPEVEYNWQISNRDKFCGIVGVWPVSKFISLAPTEETAQGGDYIDTSVQNLSGLHLDEFIVYAEPKSRQQ